MNNEVKTETKTVVYKTVTIKLADSRVVFSYRDEDCTDIAVHYGHCEEENFIVATNASKQGFHLCYEAPNTIIDAIKELLKSK